MIRLAVLAVAIAGCAASPNDPRYAGNGSGSGVVCHEVTDTGTLFSHTECTPIEQQKAEKDDAQRWSKRPRSNPTGSTK